MGDSQRLNPYAIYIGEATDLVAQDLRSSCTVYLYHTNINFTCLSEGIVARVLISSSLSDVQNRTSWFLFKIQDA